MINVDSVKIGDVIVVEDPHCEFFDAYEPGWVKSMESLVDGEYEVIRIARGKTRSVVIEDDECNTWAIDLNYAHFPESTFSPTRLDVGDLF